MKEAIKSGEINIADLYSSTSEQRRAIFEGFTSKELAQEINASFEKAIISKQKGALKAWAEKTFKPKQRESKNYQSVVDRINELDELGVLNNANADSYLSDLISDKMGANVSVEELKTISQKTENLDKLYNKKDEFGLPDVKYWEARRDIDNYIASLVPSSNLKVLTSVAGRGAMLASIKSPLTNIISNTSMGIVQAFERRLSNNSYKGANPEFALNYVKKVNEIYQKSGYDISRMETIEVGQRRLGEEATTTQGPGAIRKLGQWYEDIVFKQLMGVPDVAFSSVAFADSANLASTRLAKGNKEKALAYFKDAVKISPDTVEGEIVRSQAIADAQYSTYTNKGAFSDLAMGIRTALNNFTGDIRLGDQLMPFVKTPANVVQAGIDAAGVGAFRGFFKLPEAIKEMKEGNGQPMREAVNLFIKSGLGMTLAVVLAYAFDPDDFVGEYDILSQKERDLAKAKNAPYNSVKVGNKYISLDYLGPLASSFVGIMYARKYGNNLPEKIAQYVKGAGSQAIKLPGLKEFAGLVGDITAALRKGDVGDVAEGLTDEAVGYIRARTIPAIANDFGRGIDPYERETGGETLSKLKSGIPGVRQTLPRKTNIVTGEDIKGEGLMSTLLFGGRVKTASDSALVNEVERLYSVQEGPTISEIKKGSGRVKELKEQISPEKYNQALSDFGKEYGKNADRLINSREYKDAPDEQKKKLLNKIREKELERMLRKYNYKRPERIKK
jgi:tetratricopeptide (TPR) repeat protein